MLGKVSDLGVFLLHGMVPCCVTCDQSTALPGTARVPQTAAGTKGEQGNGGRREQLRVP